jgi:hypothetical protein
MTPFKIQKCASMQCTLIEAHQHENLEGYGRKLLLCPEHLNICWRPDMDPNKSQCSVARHPPCKIHGMHQHNEVCQKIKTISTKKLQITTSR